MPAIVEFPTLVQQALTEYGDLFATEPARQHFAEYLTGLFVAEHKNVSGINREFAVTTDQSCLNRWITQVDWDAQHLNERRLASLQRDPSTRYAAHGVIPIDNTLIDHDGKLITDVGWFWDHAEKRHLIAHDYLIANYVCPSGKHYPLEFRCFRKRDQCEARGEPFRDHTQLCIELIDWVVDQQIPGAFTFDSYFTNADVLNAIQSRARSYVGDLKFNRKVVVAGQDWKVAAWAATIPATARRRVTIGDRTQYAFTKTVRLPSVHHPVRLVVLWKEQADLRPVKILVTNRTWWESTRILRTYRQRWTGTEPFHRDGKQQLGMGECQLRSREGQTRHLYLVFLAYSCIMVQLQQARAQEWAQTRLMTVGEACRAMLRETLGQTLSWAVERALEGWTMPQIKTHLALP